MKLVSLQGHRLEIRGSPKKAFDGATLANDTADFVKALGGGENNGNGGGKEPFYQRLLNDLGLTRDHYSIFLQLAVRILGKTIADSIATTVPYVGPLKAAVQAANATRKAAKRVRAMHTIGGLKPHHYRNAEYYYATEAVAEMLAEEAGWQAGSAAMYSAAAMTAVIPGGSAARLAGSAGEILFQLTKLAIMTQHKVDADRVMKDRISEAMSDKEKKQALSAAPILGAWMLGRADTRHDQVTFHRRDRGAPQVHRNTGKWASVARTVSGGRLYKDMAYPLTEDYERYRVLMTQAARYTNEGLFEIPGLPPVHWDYSSASMEEEASLSDDDETPATSRSRSSSTSSSRSRSGSSSA